MTADVHELVCRVCSKCGQEPALPYHPYGRQCLNAAKRTSRRRQHERMERWRAELLAVTYGKELSRQTLQEIEKRAKGDK